MRRCVLLRSFGIILLLQMGASAAPITLPSGLNNGDEYRLIFATSGLIDATESNISVYDAHINNNLSAELLALGTTWKALASTATVDARVHTSTDFTVNPTGVPIYNLGDQIIADTYSDLWDGTIDNNTNFDQNGNPVPKPVSDTAFVWTGSETNGLKMATSHLGTVGSAQAGQADSTASSWLVASLGPSTLELPVYGISGILTVGGATAVPEPSGLSIMVLSLMGMAGYVWRRKRKAA